MSQSPDCIIVGGGVVGLSIARHLGREGLSVSLLERAQCGREASWAGAGVLSPCNPHRADPIYQLQEHSLSLFPEFCRALTEETGIDTEYEVCGELAPLFSKQALGIARSDERAAAQLKMPDGRPVYALHTPEETRRIEPAVCETVLGALECRRTAQVRNPRLLRALVESCRKLGVDIREHTKVEDFIVSGQRVTGVKAGGETVAAGTFVLCGGAWSSQVGEQLERLMPVYPVRGQMILLESKRRQFQRVIGREKTYLVPRRDGHVLLGATEEHEAGFEKRNTAKGVSRLMEKAMRMVPSIADASVVGMWSGLRPGTPDNKPYVGPVPGLDGLIAATGHFRSGLTLAPATAEVVAAMIQGRPYELDLACCLPGRS